MKLTKKATEPELLEKLTTYTDYDPSSNRFPDHHLPAVYNIIHNYYLENYLEDGHEYFYPKHLQYFQFPQINLQTPSYLYPHQKEAFIKMLQYYHHPLYRGIVLNMAMGSGKTLTTIEFIKHVQLKRVLIIAPKTILENVWYPELTKHIRNDKIKIYTTTYHSLHKQPTHMFDLIVADESHYLKNPRTRRVKALFSLSYKFIIFLTGTPIINHAGDVYTYFRSIYPNTYKYSINRPTFKIPYYWDWIKEFHYTKLNKFNGIDIGRLKPYKKYLLSSIVSSISYQYLKQPENTIQIIQVSTPHKLTKEQEVEQHKAEMMLDEFKYQNQVIVVQYRKTAQFLHKMLKATQKTQVITGETKDRTIQPDTQTLIITLGTGTEGIDLTMFDQMYILTPNWSPALLDQLTARIWRGDKENFNKPVYLVITNHETDRIRIGALKKKHQVVKIIGEGGGM